MKTLVVLAVATVGGVVAFRCLPRDLRDRVSSVLKHKVREGVEHMMADLPEGSPPKLVMSVLPKLQAQNERIIAMLSEQSKLLREQQQLSAGSTAA